MPQNNDILLKFGVDESALENLSKILGQKINEGLKTAFKSVDFGSVFKIDLSEQKAAFEKFNDSLEQGQVRRDAEIAAKRGQIALEDFNLQKEMSERLAAARIAEDAQVAARRRQAAEEDFKSQLNASARTSAADAKAAAVSEGNVTVSEQFAALGGRLQANVTALFKLRQELAQAGLSIADIDRKTRNFTDQNERAAVKIEQIGVKIQEEGADFVKLGNQVTKVNETLDTQERLMARISPQHVANADKVAKADGVYKNWAFSIGLVGYGMENLGRRLLGFSETLFNFIKTSAVATEQLERMRNALLIEGTSGAEQNNIEARINRIANLPGGKLEEVVKSFQEIRTAGLQASESLDLIEGLTKATTRSGKGPAGVEAAVKVLRRALLAQDHPFKTQTLDTLENQVGPEVAQAMLSAFGSVDAKTLNKAGGKSATLQISAELSKLGDGLPVTADRVNHLTDSLLRMTSHLEHVLGPSLDKTLVLFHYIEGVVESLSNRFDGLSDAQKNFISGVVAAVPAILAVGGAILSVTGVLAVGLAVYGKLASVFTSLQIAMGAVADETGVLVGGFSFFSEILPTILSFLNPITLAITAVVAVLGSAFSTNAGGFADALKYLVDTILPTLKSVLTTVYDTISALISIVVNLFNIIDVGGGLTTAIGIIGSGVAYILATALQLVNLLAFIPATLQFIADILAGNIDLAFERVLLTVFKVAKAIGVVGFLVETIFGVNLQKEIEDTEKEIARLDGTAKTAHDSMETGAETAAAKQKELQQAFQETQKTIALITESIKKQSKEIEDNTRKTELNTQAKRAEALANSFGNAGLEDDFSGKDLTSPTEQQAARSALASLTAGAEAAAKIRQDAEVQKQLRERLEKSREDYFALAETAVKAGTKEIYSKYADLLKTVLTANIPVTPELLNQTIFKKLDEDLVRVFGAPEAELAKLKYDISKKQQEIDDFYVGLARAKKDQDIRLANEISAQIVEAKIIKKGWVDQLPLLGTELKTVNKQLANEKFLIEQAFNNANQSTDILSKVQAESAAKRAKLERDIKKAEDEKIAAEAEHARKLPILASISIADQTTKTLEEDRADLTKNKKDIESITQLQTDVNEVTEKLNAAVKVQYELQLQFIDAGRDTFAGKLEQKRKALKEYNDQLNKIKFESKKQVDDTIFDLVHDSSENSKRLRALLVTFGDELKINIGLMLDLVTTGSTPDMTKLNAAVTKFNKLVTETAGNLGQGAVKPLIAANSAMFELAQSLPKNLPGMDEYFTFLHKFETATLGRPLTKEEINSLLTEAEGVVNFLKNAVLFTTNETKLANLNLTVTKIISAIEGLKAAKSALKDIINPEAEAVKFKQAANKSLQETLDVDKREIDSIQTSILNGIKNIGDMAAARDFLNTKLQKEIELIEAKYDAEILLVEANIALAKSNPELTPDEKTKKIAELEAEIARLKGLKKSAVDNATSEDPIHTTILSGFNLIYGAANKARKAITDLWGAVRSGEFVLGSLVNWSTKAGTALDFLKQMGAFAMTAFAEAFSSALVDALANGADFLSSLGKFFGQMLIQLGTMLISFGTVALAANALSAFFPFLIPLLGPPAVGVPAALAAIAIGTGLVVAGALMGGGNAPAQAATTNASNSANAQTGATGNNFDPAKDPRTNFQKALAASISIDIKHEDGIIVKTMIKEMNSNGRLAQLTNNRHLGFGY